MRSRRPSAPGCVNRPCADWRYVLMFALLLVPFYPPTGFFNVLGLDYSSVLLVLQISAAIVALFLGAVRKRLDIFSGIALAIVAVMFLSTFLNEGFGREWIYVQCFLDWMPLAVAVLMVGYARQRHMTDFLIAFLVVTGFLSICNTVSILAFPDGSISAVVNRLISLATRTRRSISFSPPSSARCCSIVGRDVVCLRVR